MFSLKEAEALLDESIKALDYGVSVVPTLPTFYPPYKVIVGNKSTPGLQVVDFIIRAMNSQIHDPKSSKAVWAERLRMRRVYATSYGEGGQLNGEYMLGNGSTIAENASNNFHTLYPIDDLTLPEFKIQEDWENMIIFVESLICNLSQKKLPIHISHLGHPIDEAAFMIRDRDKYDQIEITARVFIRLFDTLPLYHGPHKNDPRFISLLIAKSLFALALRGDLNDGIRILRRIIQTRRSLLSRSPSYLNLI